MRHLVILLGFFWVTTAFGKSPPRPSITILFKIITRMKLLFLNYLGDYSYSFQGSSELVSITVTVSLFFLQMQWQEIIPLRHSQEFSAITVTWFNGFWIRNVMISKGMVRYPPFLLLHPDSDFFFELVSGLQKGPVERGHVKKRQKSSKRVKKFFDTFRHFSRRAKNVKNRQKVSKSFSTLFDTFRAAPFSGPLLQSAELVTLRHYITVTLQ